MEESPSYTVIQLPEKGRFEVHADNQVAVLELMNLADKVVFTHTEVPLALEGKGIGSMLAKAGLEFAKAEKKAVVPLCPFVAGYIRRHPEYQELVLDGYYY